MEESKEEEEAREFIDELNMGACATTRAVTITGDLDTHMLGKYPASPA